VISINRRAARAFLIVFLIAATTLPAGCGRRRLERQHGSAVWKVQNVQRTVHAGMTLEQIVEILGPPRQVLDLKPGVRLITWANGHLNSICMIKFDDDGVAITEPDFRIGVRGKKDIWTGVADSPPSQ